MPAPASMLSRLVRPIVSRFRAIDAAVAATTLERFEDRVLADQPPASRVRLADVSMLSRTLRPERRPLIEHHWATWCDACVTELPTIARLGRLIEDHADVLTVSWDRFEGEDTAEEVEQRVARMATQHQLVMPTVIADCEPDALFDTLGLRTRQIPQTRVIDADGGILRTFDRALEEADLEAIMRLLGASA